MALNSLGIGNKLKFSVKLVRLRKHCAKHYVRLHYAAAASSKWIRSNKLTGRRCFSVVDPNIVKSESSDVEIPDVPIHEFLFKDVHLWETKVAVPSSVKKKLALTYGGLLTEECAFSGKTWTYKDLLKISQNLATSMQNKLKLDKGKVVAAVLPNCPEFMAIFLAGSMTGIVTTTINPAYTATEISLQMKDSGPSAIFTTAELHEKCVQVINLLNLKIPIIVVKWRPDADTPAGGISFDEFIVNSSGEKVRPFAFDSDLDFVLPYSSGTSGLPKGVQLTHRNIIANTLQITESPKIETIPHKETNQRFILGLLPFFHIYGMTVIAIRPLTIGDKVITLPKFEPNLFVETIWKKKAQDLYLVPPLIFFLANQPSVESKHLEYVQLVMTGAAPCGASDIDKLAHKASGAAFAQGYGLTETSPVVTLTNSKRAHKKSSIGCVLPSTQVKVVDANTGESLPQGKPGELCVKGPQVMKGYFKRPKENEAAFDSDNWFLTGDIAYYDEDKDFFIVDRMKELIKVKGFQVAPAELEEFLRKHEKISDAGVIGVEHPQHGEVPKGFVVLKKGVSCTEQEIQEYIKESLSPHKQLKGGVTFVEEIPRSAAGKILRKDLKLIEVKS